MTIVEIARATLGSIDLDPCTDSTWNARIGAWRILTASDDALNTPWVVGAPAPGDAHRESALHAEPSWRCTALVNPPGEKTGALVAGFWRALTHYYRLGWISSAVWIGFSVEQLSRLQRVGAPSHPLEYPTCIPSERVSYLEPSGYPGEQPGHASFITLLPDRARKKAQVDQFHRIARPLGAVINA
jgi:hypothetical protein